MNWRKLLLPFSGLFWLGVSVRNLLFSTGIFKSKKFKVPIICVGNLSVGGTGKSPHVMLIADFLKDEFQTAMISRGYGRKTKGLKIANYNSKVYDIGDEPLQFFNRFKNKIVVAVCEKRTLGIRHLLKYYHSEVIIMDDGFQHRQVKPGFSVLLTDFNHPYTKDFLLPAGNLREPRSAAKRADVIIVTKCPDTFTVKQRDKIIKKIKPKKHQQVFFSKIVYAQAVLGTMYNLEADSWVDYDVILVTGIANSKSLVNFVKSKFKYVQHIDFPDHHNFSISDVQKINQEFENIKNINKIILTTEKDYMRLKDERILVENLFYLPIQVELDNELMFKEIILNYVRKNPPSR